VQCFEELPFLPLLQFAFSVRSSAVRYRESVAQRFTPMPDVRRQRHLQLAVSPAGVVVVVVDRGLVD